MDHQRNWSMGDGSRWSRSNGECIMITMMNQKFGENKSDMSQCHCRVSVNSVRFQPWGVVWHVQAQRAVHCHWWWELWGESGIWEHPTGKRSLQSGRPTVSTVSIHFQRCATQIQECAESILGKSGWTCAKLSEYHCQSQWLRRQILLVAFAAQSEASIAVHGETGQKTAKTIEKLKNLIFHKNRFLIILNGIWEVWGCPGAWHGPYKPIPSNFGGIWSYMAWGKSIFMFLGNIGNSLHHQIPPNWSSGLQIGPRIFWEARAPNKTN
jgi:hypothetical protein